MADQPDELLNAWGEPVDPEDPDEEYWVPPEERKDSDDDDPDDNSNALGDDTGDDITGVVVTGRDADVVGGSEEE